MRRAKIICVYEGTQTRVDALRLFSVLNLQFVQRRFPNYLQLTSFNVILTAYFYWNTPHALHC